MPIALTDAWGRRIPQSHRSMTQRQRDQAPKFMSIFEIFALYFAGGLNKKRRTQRRFHLPTAKH
jgi:hypothetical protein